MENKDRILALIRMKAVEMEQQEQHEFSAVLDGIADKIEDMPELTAKREKGYSQIHKNSPIQYPTWVCSHCGFEDRTAKRSNFCKMCGWRFTDDE